MKCYYLLPRADPLIINWGEPLPECLLEDGHEGDHLILTQRGQYVRWLPYREPCGEVCECAEDTSTLGYECFTYSKISNKEAQALLNPPKIKTEP